MMEHPLAFVNNTRVWVKAARRFDDGSVAVWRIKPSAGVRAKIVALCWAVYLPIFALMNGVRS
jgi:hypothetical protein